MNRSDRKLLQTSHDPIEKYGYKDLIWIRIWIVYLSTSIYIQCPNKVKYRK